MNRTEGAIQFKGATGRLEQWLDIAGEFEDGALLLGNGLSTHVSSKFDYGSLYEQASSGLLQAQDRALFDRFETTNFEVVLEAIATATTVCEVFGKPTRRLQASYGRIQQALGSAVRKVHVEWSAVPDETFAALQAVLLKQAAVYTTSYDLLIYWAMAHEDGFSTDLCDLFWGGGGNEFDPSNVWLKPNRVPVYYLHGALHLVLDGAGVVRKWKKGGFQTVLEKFGSADPRDPKARPLLVTEGSASGKIRAIDGNPYLAFCHDRLAGESAPLVTFGFSFGEQDRHIAEAVNGNLSRPVAVGMRSTPPGPALKARQSEIQARLHAEQLCFFDASTHPLGQIPIVSTIPGTA